MPGQQRGYVAGISTALMSELLAQLLELLNQDMKKRRSADG